MELIPWLAASSVALAVFGGGWLLYGHFTVAQSRVRRQRQLNRLESALDGGGPADREPVSERLPLLERLALPIAGRIYSSDGKTEPDSEERLLLIQAGFRSLQSLLFFQTLRLALPGSALLAMSGYALLDGSLTGWMRTFAACTVLYLGPKYVLAWLARRRRRQLAEEMPFFVDYLRMMHSVGINFEQSLTLFAEEDRVGQPILAGELRMVNLAIRSGRSRGDAMQQMAEQFQVPELQELVSLITQADRYGAGVQEPLKLFSKRLTEKKRFELQEYVGKMSTKMVVVMVLFLLPALIIVTAGPGFLAVVRALTNMS
ncbi:MAG: type II secretion system F family protein [Sulfuricella sp.]|nr:type II secretion system F family protein [Sulfuricella sp.]